MKRSSSVSPLIPQQHALFLNSHLFRRKIRYLQHGCIYHVPTIVRLAEGWTERFGSVLINATSGVHKENTIAGAD
jgi:hypothetical protein